MCTVTGPFEGGRGTRFPLYMVTAAASRRHLCPACIGKTCSSGSPCAWAFVVRASGRPSRGGRARWITKWRPGGGAAGSSVHSRVPAGRALRPLAQAHGTARVPAFPPTRVGTQRAGGKARSAVSIYGAASGPERPGPDYRGRSRARRNRELGRGVGRGAALLPLPSAALNGHNGLVCRGGAGRARKGAGAAAGGLGASILPRAP